MARIDLLHAMTFDKVEAYLASLGWREDRRARGVLAFFIPNEGTNAPEGLELAVPIDLMDSGAPFMLEHTLRTISDLLAREYRDVIFDIMNVDRDVIVRSEEE